MGHKKWTKISKLICDPKKKESFKKIMKLVKNETKRKEFEYNCGQERVQYIKRERERMEENRLKRKK